MTATLRHQPGSNRAPVRGKPAQRGASRLVAKEPIRLRMSLPRARFAGMGGWLKGLSWPLLLLALCYGTYERPRRELELMPWIASAKVRRVWSDQLVVRLEEQLPIARWGDEALLNNQGEAFAPLELANYPHLPQLYGPKRAQQQVMQQYQVLSQMLRPMGFSVARLELRERGSWFLSTGQGIELLLGRDQDRKMRRFTAIYDKALK